MLKVLVAAAVCDHEVSCLFGLFTGSWWPVELGQRMQVSDEWTTFLVYGDFKVHVRFPMVTLIPRHRCAATTHAVSSSEEFHTLQSTRFELGNVSRL